MQVQLIPNRGNAQFSRGPEENFRNLIEFGSLLCYNIQMRLEAGH